VNEADIDPDKAPGFKALGLRDSVLKGVVSAGFVDPTEIQAQLIPEILAGFDVIGQAKTGTGKTAAFGLPILQNAVKELAMQALILVPTRELAAQVSSELDMLGRFTPIRSTHIVGGESMRHQSKAIARGTQIIVGTPGRIMDMKERGEIHFNHIKWAILDEVDRMFDIGFREDIRKILKQINSIHQTVFVSATMTEDVERLARTYMKPDAKKIVTFSGALTVKQVEQRYFACEPWDKKQLLLHMLRKEKPAAAIIFCQTKANVHRVAEYLKGKGIDAREIHGDLAQAKRNKVMESMRDGNISVLVASDLAARGLDVDHISHVINYDLPEDPDIYVHRIGRTARAGRFGQAWSLVTSEQGQRLTEIEKLTGALVELKVYEDFEPGTPPLDVQQSREKQANRPDPMKKLSERGQPDQGAFSEYTPEQLKVMFPDGKIPASLPKRTLGSRFKSHRK
jgi:ATP-dependent RNA helicase DeaD